MIGTHPRLNRRAFVGGTLAAVAAAMTPSTHAAPPSDDLIFSSVMSLSKAIRAKKVSSEEVVRAYLARIAKVNPKINAVVNVTADRALEEARRADAELARGRVSGVLHGVPMTIKDSLDTAGEVTTAGTMGRKSFVPKRDATVVARLRAAGAILLGKTNTPEFTMSYDTRNLLFGVTKNPYDVTKSPGGSSGGAAAAIASGASPFDVGSDTGGSIRVPSCFSGIAGIKPTTGRMPLTGHIIHPGQGLIDPLTQVGPMARFVDDLYPLLHITAGPDGKDPNVIPVQLKHPLAVKLRDLRVAVHTDNGILAADQDVKRTVDSAAESLLDVCAGVEESCPKILAGLFEYWDFPHAADGHEWIKRLLKQSGTEQWDPHIDWHRQTPPMSGDRIGELLAKWHQFRVEMQAWMNHYDVLICPVNAKASYPAGFELDGESIKAFMYTAAYNMTGWPGAVVRCGTSTDGMPIGVQVVAHPWREDICLAVAKHLETAFGGWKKPQI